MDVTCSQCKKTLRIPDEKVPQGQIVRIACPACSNKITIDTRSSHEGRPEPAKAPPPDQGAGQAPAEELDYGDDTSLGFYEEGTKLALVLDSDLGRKEQIRTAVEAIEFRFVDSSNTRDAISKMRFHVFDLVILAEGFDGQPLEFSPIINSINHTPMPVRRKTFLALLGDRFHTMDNMMAFAMSANLVINPGDTEKLTGILNKALAENERFYKVFMDTLKETGRD
ncbi:MAG: zinc-ribbon domain-containing protein [Thermodesulfobacteriota bacterium]